jgi:predicted glycoside hydrolase/deacetylase ChbG (UPF0249 family)
VGRRSSAADDDESTDPPGSRRDGPGAVDGGDWIGIHGHEQDTAARVLCICADDFGLRDGVNEAILALLDARRIQAISCMVGGKAWLRGVAELRTRDRKCFDAGLHLDLTESPMLPGSRGGLSQLILSSMTQLLPRQPLRLEIDAQLDAFEDGLGCAPAHIDGHRHVHQLPVVRDELLAALDERYGAALPWIRSTRPARGTAWPTPKAVLIELLGGSSFRAMADKRGFRLNGRLLGVYDFHGGEARYLALMREWLQVARSGDLLMCHPGAGSDALDSIAAARRTEFAVLAGPAFAAMLNAEGITLQPVSHGLPGPAT